MLFLSDLSRQECNTYTTTSQQEFDVPDLPTGHGEEKGFSQTQTHDGDKSPDVSDTRSHCFKSTRERSTLVRTSPGARRNQKTRLALHQVRRGQHQTSLVLRRVRGMDETKDSAPLEVHKRHGFALLRVRGHKLVLDRVYQAGTVRYARIGAQHQRGWQ